MLQSEGFVKVLVDLLAHHAAKGTGALVVSAVLDFLMFALVPPFADTTPAEQFAATLQHLHRGAGRPLFKLFHCPSAALVKGAGLLMRTLIEEGEGEVAGDMQKLALQEGAFLWHFWHAVFGTNAKEAASRQLSKHLIGIWTVNNPQVAARGATRVRQGEGRFAEDQPSTSASLNKIRSWHI